MIDYELFKTILSQESEGYIEKDDKVNFELLSMFAEYSPEKAKKLFKRYSVSYDYSVQLLCTECNKMSWTLLSKTKMFSYLQDLHMKRYKYICPECKAKIEQERLKNQPTKEELAKRLEEYTEKYINRYLNPDNSWKKGVKRWEKIGEMKTYVDRGKVAAYIKDMPYYDFLKTPYWKAISESVRYRAGNKCQLCNGTKGLNVHHRTYENHGNELYNMKDLICLCSDCHNKFHDKMENL